jgi:uncharacterized protein (TIGR00106 family)
MRVIAEICVVPIGVGVSVSEHVAACERIFTAAGLKHELHANGTNLEGEWDVVLAAVKQCHMALHAAGVVRIMSTLHLHTRTDRVQTLADKVQSVRAKGP